MKPRILAYIGVAVAAAFVLAGCYAPLANQSGHFSMSLKGIQAKGSSANVLVLVIDSDSEAALAETLWLISKGYSVGLSSTESDRLKDLGKQISTNALVRFGGNPFYQTQIDLSANGSFDIPGVPAGHSYFVKLFVLNSGVTFDMSDLDQSFFSLVQSENFVFDFNGTGQEEWMGSLTFADDQASWIPVADQPVAVQAGQTTQLGSVTLEPVPLYAP